MRRNVGFTAVVVLTLGLAIGANTAVFSVLDGVLLKPLSYPRAEELVALRQIAPGAAASGSADALSLSPSMYLTCWAIELVGINDLLRLGWGRNRVKTGDVINVDGVGAKNGTNTVNAASVSLANGELVWASQKPPGDSK